MKTTAREAKTNIQNNVQLGSMSIVNNTTTDTIV